MKTNFKLLLKCLFELIIISTKKLSDLQQNFKPESNLRQTQVISYITYKMCMAIIGFHNNKYFSQFQNRLHVCN